MNHSLVTSRLAFRTAKHRSCKAMHGLACARRALGKTEEAYRLLKRTLRLKRKIHGRCCTPLFLFSLAELAELSYYELFYIDNKEYTHAATDGIRYGRWALEIAKKVFQSNCPVTLRLEELWGSSTFDYDDYASPEFVKKSTLN